jgi:hypothetical protein
MNTIMYICWLHSLCVGQMCHSVNVRGIINYYVVASVERYPFKLYFIFVSSVQHQEMKDEVVLPFTPDCHCSIDFPENCEFLRFFFLHFFLQALLRVVVVLS